METPDTTNYATFSVKDDSAFITVKKMEGDPAKEVITTVGARLE